MSLMNRAVARELGDQAVKVLNDALGPDWRARKEGGQFDPAAGSLTVRITLEQASDEAEAARDDLTRSEWNLYAGRFGLPRDAVGSAFRHGKRTYRIVSLTPNAPKYPVIAQREPDGKTFKFPVEAVILGLPKPTSGVNLKVASR